MSCRLGVVALGDSITNGGGELQYGVALQSWALWTARGLGLPYTGVAVDGARAADVVARQLPAVEAQAGGGGTSAASTSASTTSARSTSTRRLRPRPRRRAGVPGASAASAC